MAGGHYLRFDLVVGSLLTFWLLKTIIAFISCPLKKLPGPWYTLSNLPLKLSVITGRKLYFIHDLHLKYGPVVRISPTEVAVGDLPNVEKIHKIGSGFLKTQWYKDLASPGVFNYSDPKEHAARRRLLSRPFSKTSLRTHWEGMVVEKVKLAIVGIRGDLEAHGKADLLKWWTFMATDVSGHLLFGESFRMLESGKKNEYIEILENALKGSGIGVELPLVAALLKHLPFKTFRQMFKANDYMLEYGGVAVRNARAAGSHANVFSQIMAEAEKGESSISDLDVQREAGNLIVAGSDTTAITLTYASWAILKRPHLRHALEQELLSLSDDYTDADLESLPLLNATIEETLRLYGAAPGSLPRTVPAGGSTFNGHYVPAGTTVSTQSWTLHRDPSLFHDPESFDPARFLKQESTSRVPSPPASAMQPFGSGSRVCLGIHLAYMELRVALAQFIRECKTVELSPDMTDAVMEAENFFLIAPREHRCDVVDRSSV